MRKDLKIGMAIGAVLLVVLIVYVAAPRNDDTELAQADQPLAVSDDTPTEDISDTSASPEEGAVEEPVSPEPDALVDNAASPEDSAQEQTDPFGNAGSAESDLGAIWADAFNSGEVSTTRTPPAMRAAGRTGGVTPAETTVAEPAANEVSDAEASAPERDVTPPDLTEVPAVAPQDEADSEEAAVPTRQTARTSDDGAPKPGARTHTIRPNEDYSKIARAVYGDARHYLAIERANPTLDPRRLRPGTVINLPDIESVKGPSTGARDSSRASATADRTDRTADAAGEYRVKRNDSLYKIAMSRYGTSNMIERIYEANRGTIGADPNRLREGMILKLPPNPNAGETPVPTASR